MTQPPKTPNPKVARAGGRSGPRPLALHLSTQLLAWTAARAALPRMKGGQAPIDPLLGEPDPHLASLAAELGRASADVPLEAFAAALDAEAARRLGRFNAGVKSYRRHPYRRRLKEPPTVWRDGSVRLLDYGAVRPGAGDGVPVLVVPSLVNRAYVLDLTGRRSLLRHLARRGFRPLLVDWGDPGPAERRFTLTDYIAGLLEGALDAARDVSGRSSMPVIGYCMGGLLALALALRRPREIDGLALLATPWDFHAERAEQARLIGLLSRVWMPSLAAPGEVPVDVLNALFAALDPFLAARKFQRFAGLDGRSAEAREFVALEDWVNDGMALALPVARECLEEWYGANTTAEGRWTVGGAPVRPERLRCPAFIAIPKRDHIVPPPSAEALAAALPPGRVTRRIVPAGHIGMVTGSRAETELYRPLTRWLRDLVGPDT